MTKLNFKSAIRILCGIFFLSIGIYQLYAYKLLSIFVPLPFGAEVFVFVDGGLVCISALGIITKRFFRGSLLMLGLTLAITALIIQVPVMFRERDEILMILGLSNIIKLAVACGVFIVLSFMPKK